MDRKGVIVNKDCRGKSSLKWMCETKKHIRRIPFLRGDSIVKYLWRCLLRHKWWGASNFLKNENSAEMLQ
jgi:hypothetical protein